MSTRLPIVHIRQLVEGRASRRRTDGQWTVSELRELVDRLSDAGATTPSVAFLDAGYVPLVSIDDPFLLAISDLRRMALGAWAGILGMAGVSSVAYCASEALDDADTIAASDLPLLTGSGVAIASQGVTDRPLVGLSLSELRDELTDSHDRLSEAAGFPIRLLAPTPTADGRALDGLVVREARRVGYRTFLKPGGIADVSSPAPEDPLTYRTLLRDDGPERLTDWIAGDVLARGSAELQRLAAGPRRLLSRLQSMTRRDD